MDQRAIDVLRAEFDVFSDPGLGTDRDHLLPLLVDAEALIVRNETTVDSELLSAAPGLKVVARLGVGVDNIDLEACNKRGVEVAPARGANAVAVAEYVIGALLFLTRGVFGDSSRVIAGEWPRLELRGGELAGKQLGLIGYGAIAREVARTAIALGMDAVAYDPYLKRDDPGWDTVIPVELPELLAGSAAVSVHVPLSQETHHLLGSEAVAMMSPDALVINTSRGGVVDESAVISALSNGRLGGAALDVFETEPLDSKSGARFSGVPNLILTPHVAGITTESEARIGDMTVATVRRHLGPT